jgi:hypothetical protein
MVMKKIAFIFCLIAVVVVAMIAEGGQGQSKKFAAKAFTEDPDETDAVVAAWLTHVGLPDAGKSNHALFLQKDTDTATNALAGAKIKWLKNKLVTDLTELGFDYMNGGHCTANAPRFVITVDAVEFTFGCSSGTASPAPDDPVNWTRVRFDLTTLPTTGTIEDAKIIFDEGTDAGTGQIYLDNIDINGALIGKPGKAKPPTLP